MKPLYDYIVKGKRFGPLSPWSRSRPGYTAYPDKRSYPDNILVGPTKNAAKSAMGNRTEIRGHGDSTDDTIGLKDITVQRTFDVENQANHDPRGEETGGVVHRSMV